MWLASVGLIALTQSARAQLPAGYTETHVSATDSNGDLPIAVAYAPNGTLYVVLGAQNFGGASSTIDVINPNGTLGTPITVSAAAGTPGPAFGGFYSVGGAAFDSATGALLVTDAAPGVLYSINPATGAATTVAAGGNVFPGGQQYIAQVAVQPGTGNILVSDASGPPGQGRHLSGHAGQRRVGKSHAGSYRPGTTARAWASTRQEIWSISR